VSQQFVVLMASASQGVGVERRRLGVTVSRRIGNAVRRNHIKRAVREWFRQSRESLAQTADIVVIARRSARELSTPEVWAVLNAMAISEQRINW
jgi:ribonuclease P protein component